MTWISTHADDAQHWRVILVDWNISGTHYRWTNYDIPIVTSGSAGATAATWSPMPFTISGISTTQGEASSRAQIDIGNADGAFTSFAWVASNTQITVYEAWLDPTANNVISQQEVTLLTATVDSWVLTPAAFSLYLSPLSPLVSTRIPRRQITVQCSFQFKGPACGYAGAETECNRTPARCTALLNQTRFGGFPRLDSK